MSRFLSSRFARSNRRFFFLSYSSQNGGKRHFFCIHDNRRTFRRQLIAFHSNRMFDHSTGDRMASCALFGDAVVKAEHRVLEISVVFSLSRSHCDLCWKQVVVPPLHHRNRVMGRGRQSTAVLQGNFFWRMFGLFCFRRFRFYRFGESLLTHQSSSCFVTHLLGTLDVSTFFDEIEGIPSPCFTRRYLDARVDQKTILDFGL